LTFSVIIEAAPPPIWFIKPCATALLAVQVLIDHHVIILPGSYSSYRSTAIPRQS